MKIIAYPNKENWPDLLARPAFETNELDRVVHAILTEVREQEMLL